MTRRPASPQRGFTLVELLVTMTVLTLVVLIAGGLVVVESMFGFPGLGRLLVFAIQNRDVPLIQAISLIVAALYAGGNLLADLVQRWLDPRTREGG